MPDYDKELCHQDFLTAVLRAAVATSNPFLSYLLWFGILDDMLGGNNMDFTISFNSTFLLLIPATIFSIYPDNMLVDLVEMTTGHRHSLHQLQLLQSSSKLILQ